MKPHKHAELIKAWADGAEIEFYLNGMWKYKPDPCWAEDIEYRIKPQPRPDVVRYACFGPYKGGWEDLWLRLYSLQQNLLSPVEQIKLTFDGETGKLKSAEVL